MPGILDNLIPQDTKDAVAQLKKLLIAQTVGIFIIVAILLAPKLKL